MMTQHNKKLSTRQICSIIEACFKNNVSKLSYEDLTLEFHPSHSQYQPYTEPHIEVDTPSFTKAIDPEDDSQEVLSEYELAILDAEDPSLFEKKLLDEDISAEWDEDQ